MQQVYWAWLVVASIRYACRRASDATDGADSTQGDPDQPGTDPRMCCWARLSSMCSNGGCTGTCLVAGAASSAVGRVIDEVLQRNDTRVDDSSSTHQEVNWSVGIPADCAHARNCAHALPTHTIPSQADRSGSTMHKFRQHVYCVRFVRYQLL